MPFTVSHVAVVLPLTRTPLPASALVIGSMVPDLPVHLAQRPHQQTHSWSGLVGEDLVLGLIVWALWHALLAAPLLAAAPAAARARCADLAVGLAARVRSVRHLALVVAGLLVGSALHVFLDSFTHVDRWGVEHVPALSVTYAGHAGYSWLQYGGSVVLLTVLVGVLARAWLPSFAGAGRAVHGLCAVLALAAVSGGLLGLADAANGGDVRTVAYYAITRACGLLAATALLLALAWHLRRAWVTLSAG